MSEPPRHGVPGGLRRDTSGGSERRIAAVVVHYGDPAPTRRCLDSLDGIDEIILVDQPPALHGPHPRVRVRIEPGANIGFAAACNRAVEATDAPLVLVLNNDAWMAPGSVAALLESVDRLDEGDAGACLKLLGADGATIQSAGGLWFTRDGIGFPHGFGEIDDGQYDGMTAGEIGVPSGAAALYRTSAWREAGGMAGEFFCYGEDGDLGLRMVAAGWSFAWLPRVSVLHELSSSSGAHSAFKAFHVERNHFATMLHCAPAQTLLLLPFLTLMRIARTAFDAARGTGAGAGLTRESSPAELAATLLRAWAGALGMIPAALARRRDLVRRHAGATTRAGLFLARTRVSLATFARSRGTASAPPL